MKQWLQNTWAQHRRMLVGKLQQGNVHRAYYPGLEPINSYVIQYNIIFPWPSSNLQGNNCLEMV